MDQTQPTSQTQTPASKKSKAPKAYIIGMVICAILAVAGIALGTYGLINSLTINLRNCQIKTYDFAKSIFTKVPSQNLRKRQISL